MQRSHSLKNQRPKIQPQHNRHSRQLYSSSYQPAEDVRQLPPIPGYQVQNPPFHQHQPHQRPGFQFQVRNYSETTHHHPSYQPSNQPPSPNPPAPAPSPTESFGPLLPYRDLAIDPNLLSPSYTRSPDPSISHSSSHSPVIPGLMATTAVYKPVEADHGLRRCDMDDHNYDIFLPGPSTTHNRSNYRDTTPECISPNNLFSSLSPRPNRDDSPILHFLLDNSELHPSHLSHQPTDALPAFSQQSGSIYNGVAEYQRWDKTVSESIGSSDEEREQRETELRQHYENPDRNYHLGAGLLGIGGAGEEPIPLDAEKRYISPTEVISAHYQSQAEDYSNRHLPKRYMELHHEQDHTHDHRYLQQHHPTPATSISHYNRNPKNSEDDQSPSQSRQYRPYPLTKRKPATRGLSRRGSGISSFPRPPLPPHTTSDTTAPQPPRPFHCTFLFAGCPATFSSKNEWKRHVSSQHTQLTIWRCRFPSCAARPNSIFNRKDLFGQHLKRTHMPNFASSLSGAATDRELARRKKEWTHNELPKLLNDGMIINREAPMKSTCGFCQRRFEGKGSWDVRMEHVGRHYEMSGTNGEGVGVENWSADSDLVEWADENGIVVEDKVRGGYKLAAGGGKEAVVEGTSVRRHIGYYG